MCAVAVGIAQQIATDVNPPTVKPDVVGSTTPRPDNQREYTHEAYDVFFSQPIKHDICPSS